jgi:hypothetical protein
MTLEKAILKARSGGKDIQFMFNPKELQFEEEVETSDNPGARSEKSGSPKVSFSNIPAKKITISNILFDTFESGENVMEAYVNDWCKAARFLEDKEKQRPPVYTFAWGTATPYLEFCFVEKLSYKLTKFLPDGTPVRAVIDSLVLKETDKPPEDDTQLPPAQANPAGDNMKTRQNQ